MARSRQVMSARMGTRNGWVAERPGQSRGSGTMISSTMDTTTAMVKPPPRKAPT